MEPLLEDLIHPAGGKHPSTMDQTVRPNVEGTEEAIGVEATVAVATVNRFRLTLAPSHHHGNHLPLVLQVLGWVFPLHPHQRIMAAGEVVVTAKGDGPVLLLGHLELIQAIRVPRHRSTGLTINIETPGGTDNSGLNSYDERISVFSTATCIDMRAANLVVKALGI